MCIKINFNQFYYKWSISKRNIKFCFAQKDEKNKIKSWKKLNICNRIVKFEVETFEHFIQIIQLIRKQ